MNNSNL
jgi:hypothetical protein